MTNKKPQTYTVEMTEEQILYLHALLQAEIVDSVNGAGECEAEREVLELSDLLNEVVLSLA